MQLRAGRIGEHFQHIEFIADIVGVKMVELCLLPFSCHLASISLRLIIAPLDFCFK
jgi:hypothetical protein